MFRVKKYLIIFTFLLVFGSVGTLLFVKQPKNETAPTIDNVSNGMSASAKALEDAGGDEEETEGEELEVENKPKLPFQDTSSNFGLVDFENIDQMVDYFVEIFDDFPAYMAKHEANEGDSVYIVAKTLRETLVHYEDEIIKCGMIEDFSELQTYAYEVQRNSVLIVGEGYDVPEDIRDKMVAKLYEIDKKLGG